MGDIGKITVIEDKWTLQGSPVSTFLIGVRVKNARYGFLFWTGPEDNQYSPWLADAWQSRTKAKAFAQHALIESEEIKQGSTREKLTSIERSEK